MNVTPRTICTGNFVHDVGPYIKRVTEPLTRVLKKYDVTIVNKPFTTLQQQFPAPNRRPTSCTKFPVQIVVVLHWGNRQSF